MDVVYAIENVQMNGNARPVEDVTIEDCGELPLDLDTEGKEDFDDDVTHTLPDATATEEVPSEASESPATSSLETALEEPTGEAGAGRYIVIGLILLTIATAVFV